LSHAAATINFSNDEEDDNSYVSHSSSSERSVGRKGSFSDGDNSRDPSYKAPDSDDDGLFYSDDEILDAEFERGLDEVARAIEYADPKKMNHGRRRTTVIVGGPAQPDYTGMTGREKENAKAEYEVKRKAYADQCRRKRLKGNVELDSAAVARYTGCLHPTLRPMSDVEANRLEVGHTFPDIELLKLRIAEEANLRGISYKTTRSEIRQIRCYGYLFVVEANNTEYTQGFCVTVCSVRHGDDYTNLPHNAAKYNVPLEKYCSPFKTAMVVPLILGMIADNPGCTNKTLRGFLKGYGSDYAFTESILQEAKSTARMQLFGSPGINVTYAETVKLELQKLGHIVRLAYTGRRETLKKIEVVVLSEELLRKKHLDNSTMDKAERLEYISQWKQDHRDLLLEQLGPKDVNVSFLDGIFFSPSFSQGTVPQLQRLMMADACHLNFGKYTLYSCYGITANANMFPVGFAIIFGNENLLSWKAFWKFVVELHPSVNQRCITVLRQQLLNQ
jgi:hypothetical protein